jgi:hypothetical protein
MTNHRNWKAMWADYAGRLYEQTGEDVWTWNDRIRSDAPNDESGLRGWLNEREIRGYMQHLLIMERFGYPDYLQTTDEELIDNQYADREHLRPIFDRLILTVQSNHPKVEIVGRKTYVPLYTPRRQFAVVKATTRKRIDLGLRLDGQEQRGRLLPAKSLGNETINLRAPLASVEEIDDELMELIAQAWACNSW